MKASEIVIENMLNAGRDPIYIASRLRATPAQVRRVARKHNLPLNRPLRIGGRVHRSIQKSFANGARPRDLATLFRQTPERIMQAIDTPASPKPKPPEYI